MKENTTKNLFYPLIASVVFHSILLFILNLLIGQVKPKSGRRILIAFPKKPVKVKPVTPEDLKKFRTVGKKNGGQNFNMQVPKGNNAKEDSRQGKIDLSSLRASENISDITPRQNPPAPKQKQKDSGRLKITATAEDGHRKREKELVAKQTTLQKLAPDPEAARLLKATGFNIHFEPPEGVKEDELNTAEKIYYSFQKRTFISYVTSFLKTYNRMIIQRPTLKKPLRDEQHFLTGKIIFDKEGNIMTIKILRSSHNDDVHELFEETLKEIRSLPNPPKDLVRKSGEFTIYYQLRING